MKTNNKNWKLVESKIPHQPYHIVNSNDEMVCTIFQSKEDLDYAIAIQNIPRFKKLLKMVLEYDSFTKDEDNSYPLEEELFTLAKKIDKNKFHTSKIIQKDISTSDKNPQHFNTDLIKLLKDDPLAEIPIEEFKNK